MRFPDVVLEAIDTGPSGHRLELRWPIIIVRPPNEIDERIAEELNGFMRLLLSNKIVFGMATDLRGVKLPNARVRKMFMEFQRENAELFRRYFAADASVISNPLERGLVTAINWFSPPPQRQAFFPTLEKAIAWADEYTRPLA